MRGIVYGFIFAISAYMCCIGLVLMINGCGDDGGDAPQNEINIDGDGNAVAVGSGDGDVNASVNNDTDADDPVLECVEYCECRGNPAEGITKTDCYQKCLMGIRKEACGSFSASGLPDEGGDL